LIALPVQAEYCSTIVILVNLCNGDRTTTCHPSLFNVNQSITMDMCCGSVHSWLSGVFASGVFYGLFLLSSSLIIPGSLKCFPSHCLTSAFLGIFRCSSFHPFGIFWCPTSLPDVSHCLSRLPQGCVFQGWVAYSYNDVFIIYLYFKMKSLS